MKALSVSAACALVFASITEAKTFLFPIPQEVSWYGTHTPISKDFEFQGIENTILEKAADRYLSLIQNEKWVPVQVSSDNSTAFYVDKKLKGVRVDVNDNDAKLDYQVNESYTLDIPSGGGYGSLKAETWVGALRALETLSQLIVASEKEGNDEEEDDNDIISPVTIHTVSIIDSPSYPHRGIMLDTSRNFYDVDTILRVIDAQSYNKMNVLHWHATDSQSWPLYFKSHPELSKKGAYSSAEVYSTKDVKKIISYAEERGIRVILEIDMPAHTAIIGESHPNYILCRPEFWAEYAVEPPAGQLNPIMEEAFELIKDIVKEAAETFPDSFYHTGGDEIKTNCWELDPAVTNYISDNNMTTNELWFQWENTLLDFIINQTHKRPIIWEDPIRDGGSVPKKTVVQTWIAPPANYTSIGHDVIVTNSDYFYLDCGVGGWVGNDPRYISPTQTESANDTFNYGGPGGSWCSPYKSWQRVYSFDLTYGIEAWHTGKVLGGESVVWSEQSGPEVIEGRLWPRAAAAAEIYWSGSHDMKGTRRTVKDVSERFYDWVYRLQSRGIAASPVQPKWCAKHPGACDLNKPENSFIKEKLQHSD